MIDYEKLKLAEELCSKIDSYFVCEISSLKGAINFTLCHKDQYDEDYKNIDDLIAKLQELTKPKPIYAIGQEVFFRDDLKIGSFKVDEIVNDYGQDWYIHQHDEGGYQSDGQWFDQYEAQELYPTKSQLIEAQIKYWKSLREPTIMAGIAATTEPLIPYPAFEGVIKDFNEKYISDKSNIDKQDNCRHGPYNNSCSNCLPQNECQHESDGNFYMNGKIHNTVPSGLSLNELMKKGLRKKCEKCGEFYR